MPKPASETAPTDANDLPLPLPEAPETEAMGKDYEGDNPPDYDAECDMGCDWPEGPLSPSGCRW